MRELFKKVKTITIIAYIGIIIGLCSAITGLMVLTSNEDDDLNNIPYEQALENTRSICEFIVKRDTVFYPNYYLNRYFSTDNCGYKIVYNNRLYYDSISEMDLNNLLLYDFRIRINKEEIKFEKASYTGDDEEVNNIISNAKDYSSEYYNWIKDIESMDSDNGAVIYIQAAINPDMYLYWDNFEEYMVIMDDLRKPAITMLIIGIIFTACGMIYSIKYSLREIRTNDYISMFKLGRLMDKIPSFSVTLLTILMLFLSCSGFWHLHHNIIFEIRECMNLTVLLAFVAVIALSLSVMSIVRRCKRMSYVSDSPILCFVIKKWNSLPKINRALLVIGAMVLIFIACVITACAADSAAGVIPAIVTTAVFAVSAIYIIRDYLKVEKMYTDYGKGEWSVETPKVGRVMRDLALALEEIKKTMQLTIEKSVKDERTKAELITNVSHDIKTPLTSIINYIGLLQKDDTTLEQREEYYEVLNRQSSRMKKLIEDLIEASKAATHNIEMNFTECSIGTLLHQVGAEYEVQASKNNLNIIISTSDELNPVRVDCQKIYRVFDNLLSNACKYSLEGSRIFVMASNECDKVKIEFRNTCRELPQISVEELTERFVRGDISRTSEGSGLGLAIAKDLTELMDGTLRLKIDKDIFYAIIELNSIVQK